MYNSKYIIPGLLIFVGLVTIPFWLNLGSPDYKRPELALPAGQTECVEPVAYMNAEHMDLLDTWRDALRDGNRTYVATNGKKWEISLQNTCMECHTNYDEFCKKCHDSNSVDPYCWDCHVEPRGNQ